MDEKEREEKIDSLIELISGKMFEVRTSLLPATATMCSSTQIVMRKDASRVVQSVLKFGSALQRDTVFEELQRALFCPPLSGFSLTTPS